MNDAANRLRKIKQEEIMPDDSRILHSTDAHYQRVQGLTDLLPLIRFQRHGEFPQLSHSIHPRPDQSRGSQPPNHSSNGKCRTTQHTLTIGSKCKECGEQNSEHLPNHQHECWPKPRLKSQRVPRSSSGAPRQGTVRRS
jgi:hypothetical protein